MAFVEAGGAYGGWWGQRRVMGLAEVDNPGKGRGLRGSKRIALI